MAEKELITKERIASRNDSFLSGPKILKKPCTDFAVALRKSKRQEAIDDKRRKVCLGPSTSDQSAINMQSVMSVAINRENFQKLSECLKIPQDSFHLYNGISTLRHFTLQKQEFVFKLIMDLKIIPLVIRILQNPIIQSLYIKEAIWAVCNMASGPSYIVTALVNEKADEICKDFLHSNDSDIFEYALWGLSNIAGDNSIYREKIHNMGVIEMLLERIDSLDFMMPTVLWTIRNICEGGTILKESTLVNLLGLLRRLTRWKKSDEITIEMMWILNNITDGDAKQIKKLVESKILDFTLQASSSQNSKISIPALRALGNIAAGTADLSEILLSKNILEFLYSQYEKSSSFRVKYYVLWIISNITAGTRSQVIIITQHPILIKIVTAINSPDSTCRKEALIAFNNISKSGAHTSLMALINVGFIKESKEFLLNSTDPILVASIIETILTILKELEYSHTSEIVALMNQNDYSSCLLQNIATKSAKVESMVNKIFNYLDFEVEDLECQFS